MPSSESTPRPTAPDVAAAFLAGTRQTLRMLFGLEPRIAPLHPRTPPRPGAAEAVVVIGLTGAIGGQFTLTMSRATAIEMASSLLGESLKRFDASTHAAIAEVATMTADACASELHSQGWQAHCTVPSVILGEQVQVAWPDLAVQETAIELPFGDVTLSIGLMPEGVAV